ncbi:hypothetical protein ACQPYK_00220 [Streptosporangium sp. CA-135522]|uniref:hypothetical protein n=1 Tax=Streptosporangium sp. CA-135522 TaxID=3240072 RepID=UPI003D8ABEA0
MATLQVRRPALTVSERTVATTVVRALVRNGAVVRAVLLAVAALTLLAAHLPMMIPVAVTLYVVANAAALTTATVKAERNRARAAGR